MPINYYEKRNGERNDIGEPPCQHVYIYYVCGHEHTLNNEMILIGFFELKHIYGLPGAHIDHK